VVEALARGVASDQSELKELRARIEPTVPELELVPDLRLLDMIIWTSQDDRLRRRAKQGARWRDRSVGRRIRLEYYAQRTVAR
jgi:hypothetical protein